MHCLRKKKSWLEDTYVPVLLYVPGCWILFRSTVYEMVPATPPYSYVPPGFRKRGRGAVVVLVVVSVVPSVTVVFGGVGIGDGCFC